MARKDDNDNNSSSNGGAGGDKRFHESLQNYQAARLLPKKPPTLMVVSHEDVGLQLSSGPPPYACRLHKAVAVSPWPSRSQPSRPIDTLPKISAGAGTFRGSAVERLESRPWPNGASWRRRRATTTHTRRCAALHIVPPAARLSAWHIEAAAEMGVASIVLCRSELRSCLEKGTGQVVKILEATISAVSVPLDLTPKVTTAPEDELAGTPMGLEGQDGAASY
ncbi:hypothetical protein IWX46DRAFT_665910 [Phyllosticta citricarpa]|uniref:Uncharacterized protein n=1 Tax=Phyllosticta citricarpa TaxID=55181 RepID=A0ABR1LMS3_9PEZI